MLDALILPALAALVLSFVILVWTMWLRKPQDRALRVGAEPQEDDQDLADPEGP